MACLILHPKVITARWDGICRITQAYTEGVGSSNFLEFLELDPLDFF